MENLVKEAYEMGKKAVGFHNSAPHSNPEFMATVPNCAFGDEKGVKLRIEMYKAYIKGWTEKNLSQDIEDYEADLTKVKVQCKGMKL